MSGSNNIRWRESDLQEYRRLAKNYNAKIARERKKLISQDKRYEAAQLPSKISTRGFQERIGTRRELNQELDQMQRFIKTGSTLKLSANTRRSLAATTRDFDKKVDRLAAKAKSSTHRAALPEKISEQWVLRNLKSEEAVKSFIQNRKAFLRRGAEELVTLPDTKFNIQITKWQNETMDAHLEKINAAREHELEKWRTTEVSYGGKKAGYTQGQIRMDHGVDDEFTPMKKHYWSTDYSALREKYRLMLREDQPGYWDARTELARINYLEKLKEVTKGSDAGQMIFDKVSKLPLDDFRRILDAEDLFGDVYDLESDSKEQLNKTQMTKIWKSWKKEGDPEKAEQAFLDALEKI